MKKLLLLLVVLTLVGCSSTIDGMVYLKASHDILEISDTASLLDVLPGNLHMTKFNEEEKRTSVNYSVPLSLDMDEISEFWENDDVYKEIFLYNGGILLNKNPALEEVLFFLETKEWIYSVYVVRDEVDDIFEATDFKEKKELSSFLKSTSNKSKIDAYYVKHSVLMFARDEDC